MESYYSLNTSRLPSGSALIASQWKNELRHSDTFFKLSPWNNMFAWSELPVLTTMSLSSASVTVKFNCVWHCLIKTFQRLSDNVSIVTSLLTHSFVLNTCIRKQATNNLEQENRGHSGLACRWKRKVSKLDDTLKQSVLRLLFLLCHPH